MAGRNRPGISLARVGGLLLLIAGLVGMASLVAFAEPGTPAASPGGSVISRADLPETAIIRDQAAAQGLLGYVRQRVKADLGLGYPESVPVEMRPGTSDGSLGYCRMTEVGDGKVAITFVVDNNLTRDECFWSLCHQYGHTIMFSLSQFEKRDSDYREGFAEWVAYYTCRAEGVSESLMARILKQRPQYAKGLNIYLRMEKKLGVEGIDKALGAGHLKELFDNYRSGREG